MTQKPHPDDWHGTSDSAAAIRSRAAATTPSERLAWLASALEFAESTGALARERARRQREVMALWNGEAPESGDRPTA